MWNEPTDEILERLPTVTDATQKPWAQRIIYQHYFVGQADWYVAGYTSNQRTFFGYVVLEGRKRPGWCQFTLDDLLAVRCRGDHVDRNLYWEPKPAGEVERIVLGMKGDDLPF